MNTTEQHSQTVFSAFIANFEPGSIVFIADFEHLNDRWECFVSILTIAMQVTINSLAHLTRTLLLLQQRSQVFQKGQN